MPLMEVVDRLSVEFHGEFSQDEIEVVVEQTTARWNDAPVQAFVPLLAENMARKRLKRLLAARRPPR